MAGIETLSQHRKALSECRLAELWQGELDLELTALDAAWEQLQQIDTKLTELARLISQVQLLETIPGVGRKTAEVIVAQHSQRTGNLSLCWISPKSASIWANESLGADYAARVKVITYCISRSSMDNVAIQHLGSANV